MDLEDFENGTAYARYGSFGVGLFSVDPEEDGYPLTVADYSGTAGGTPGAAAGKREGRCGGTPTSLPTQEVKEAPDPVLLASTFRAHLAPTPATQSTGARTVHPFGRRAKGASSQAAGHPGLVFCWASKVWWLHLSGLGFSSEAEAGGSA